jgi:hypothetical protein
MHNNPIVIVKVIVNAASQYDSEGSTKYL